MPIFIVEESVPQYLTWRAEVEASSEAEAIEKFIDGEHDGEKGPFCGDSIQSLPVLRTVRSQRAVASHNHFEPTAPSGAVSFSTRVHVSTLR